MRLLPFTYAVRNLGRSSLRLTLSVLGAFLVVLLVLAAGGFIRGMQASLGASGSDRNVMVVGIGSEESLERSEISASSASLLAASIKGLRADLGTPFVSPEVHAQLPIRVGQNDRPPLILVRGITPVAMLVHQGVQIVEGRMPTPGHDELLAGALAYAKLQVHPAALAVGSSVTIENRPFKVVGRVAAPRNVIEGELWMPITDLKEITKRTTDSCVILTLGEGPDAAELGDVQAFCRTRVDLELSAMTEAAYYRKLAAFFAPIRVAAWITAGLIALGGLFGGLNTMYAAFASRVRELGMLQCLGYRRSAIAISLIQESSLTAATGALLASAVALTLLDGLAVQFSFGAFGLRIDPPVLLLGLGAGAALGVIGALPPAYRCLKPPIPETLKAI